MWWFLTEDFIYISLMSNYTEHLFIGLSAICLSSFVKCQLKSFAYFYWAVCFIIDSLYILDTNAGFLLNTNNRT